MGKTARKLTCIRYQYSLKIEVTLANVVYSGGEVTVDDENYSLEEDIGIYNLGIKEENILFMLRLRHYLDVLCAPISRSLIVVSLSMGSL
jgi:hypothetical protein